MVGAGRISDGRRGNGADRKCVWMLTELGASELTRQTSGAVPRANMPTSHSVITI